MSCRGDVDVAYDTRVNHLRCSEPRRAVYNNSLIQLPSCAAGDEVLALFTQMLMLMLMVSQRMW